MNNIKLVSRRNLIFTGADTEEQREFIVAPPIIREISNQIRHLCVSLPEGDLYLLSWTIKKGSWRELYNE